MPISTNCPFCLTTFSDYEDWAFEHMRPCDECGETYCPSLNDYCPCASSYYDDDDSDGVPYGSGIYGYSFTPELEFHGEGDYHLGIELEISANYDTRTAHPIYNWATHNGHNGLFYVKEDSSVQGFEIVTHPMTPDYFESVDWDAFFAMLNETYPLASRRRQESQNHGLHVHVSRTAFPTMAGLARWSYLLNRPGREHMLRIARRVSDQWGAFSNSPVRDVMTMATPTYWRWAQSNRFMSNGRLRHSGDYDYRTVDCTCGCGGTYEEQRFVPAPPPSYRDRAPSRPARYQAVNLQNPETVELRAFRSTRSAAEFKDTIRTVYATVEYVRTMQPQHMTTVATSEAMRWEAFTEFVRDRYSELYPTVVGMPVTPADESVVVSEAGYSAHVQTDDERLSALLADLVASTDTFPNQSEF